MGWIFTLAILLVGGIVLAYLVGQSKKNPDHRLQDSEKTDLEQP